MGLRNADNYRGVSLLFPDAINRIFAKFPQIFLRTSTKKPFLTTPTSEVLKFSRTSRKWTFLKRSLFQKTLFPTLMNARVAARRCMRSCACSLRSGHETHGNVNWEASWPIHPCVWGGEEMDTTYKAWWVALHWVCDSQTTGPAPLQKCVGDFCCVNSGGFYRGFSWRIFLGTFPTKMRKKSGDKIHEQIWRPKNKNPRKIRSDKNRP